MENTLYTGFARSKMTPPMGLHIPGHGFVPRLSTGVMDDIYLTAVAFSDGENRAVLYNCDALGVTTAGTAEIQEKVSKRTGIPQEAVYIACTHCHTAIDVGSTQSSNEAHRYYQGWLHQLFCDLPAHLVGAGQGG